MGTKSKMPGAELVDEAVSERRTELDYGFNDDLIIDHIADAIIIIDSEGDIRKINKPAESIFNYTRDELIGQKIERLIPERFHHQHIKNRRDYVSNPRIRPMGVGIDLWARRKDGTEFPCEASLSPILIANDKYTICSLRDISDRKQVEEELKKQRENMAHLVRVQALGEMAAGIAHEINQPLAAINSYAEASKRHLQSGESRTEKVMELTGKISDQAKRAGSVVSHLRAMMQNKISNPVALDINNLLMDVAELAEIETKSNDCKLIFKYSHSLPNVVCDGIQIQQVALNLISNAVDAMHDAASDVEKNITVETRAKDNNYVEVCVTDNGSGINVQDVGNIYEAFYTTKDSGLGMGLSICKSIIENHGGELGYSQNETGGSKFCFSLPVEKSEKSII